MKFRCGWSFTRRSQKERSCSNCHRVINIGSSIMIHKNSNWTNIICIKCFSLLISDGKENSLGHIMLKTVKEKIGEKVFMAEML